MKLPEHLNKRKKLTQAQREEIQERYKLGNVSQRELAREYNVSRRTVQFCIDPSKYDASKERRRRAWAEGKYREYYNKDKQREAVRSIRARYKIAGIKKI